MSSAPVIRSAISRGFWPRRLASDIATLKGLIEEHRRLTGSGVAARVLDAWGSYLPRFIKIMPRDYQRVLAERAARGEQTLEPELVHHG